MNPSAGVEVQLCQPMIDEGRAHASRGSTFYAMHIQPQSLSTDVKKKEIKKVKGRMRERTASQQPFAISGQINISLVTKMTGSNST